ncbi:MAG: hypothetical protein GVY18_04030 [Bacteroidetes bacterium]|jgi:hypothetical protein|nr:hypothetical protein [Bacteroidota bacterium]
MATIPLPPDFSAFLRLLHAHDVRYLLIGGHAVGYHGYVRATADMDIWVPQEPGNAERLIQALHAFGFDVPALSAGLFLKDDQIVRMGVPPMRIEIQTSISGVTFDDCYPERAVVESTEVPIHVISLDKLKENKRASGRLKDLVDLEHLP